MWTCPECETRNEDNRKYCDCCGLEKRLIKGVVLPVDSVKNERKNYDQKKDWNQELTDSYTYDEGGSATKIGEKRSKEEVFSPVYSVKNDRKVLIRYILYIVFGILLICIGVWGNELYEGLTEWMKMENRE